jgi:hypothetical protein
MHESREVGPGDCIRGPYLRNSGHFTPPGRCISCREYPINFYAHDQKDDLQLETRVGIVEEPRLTPRSL